MPSDPRNNYAAAWIEDIISAEKTTTWEDDFVESLDRQVKANRELSEKQLDISRENLHREDLNVAVNKPNNQKEKEN